MQETPRKGADTRERILDVAEASVLDKGFAAKFLVHHYPYLLNL
jgi:hypothetical protein